MSSQTMSILPSMLGRPGSRTSLGAAILRLQRHAGPVFVNSLASPSSCSSALPHKVTPCSRRWCAGAAEVVPEAYASSSDPFTSRLREDLRSGGPPAVARTALAELGGYRGNEVAWQRVTELLCETSAGSPHSMPHLREMSMEDLLKFVKIFAEEAAVTQASFWERLTQATKATFQAADVSLKDSMELAGLFTLIGAWQKEVFQATLGKVAREVAVHWMEPAQLTELLAIFSRAGAASREISGLTTRLFNELEERVVEDFGAPQKRGPEDGSEFKTEEIISVVESMARFSTRENEVILRLFGRERLHPSLLELPGQQIAAVCHAYAALGWRHDTVFKQVMTAILEEQEKLQRARLLGQARSSQEQVTFRASEVALVADALVRLRMYRGNNDWYRWGENYEELLDVLVRRLESGELASMPARSLAAAAYALGRARRGSEELCAALLARMMKLLECGQADPDGELNACRFREAPQEHLERFMHGLAMMGPSKRKEFLDTQWLREWMCLHYYTLSLADLIRVNRHLVALRCFDQPYLETFVPLLSEPETMSQLRKSDVQELTHTYNGAKLGEEELGKHFWWALGRQFQKQHVEGLASRRRPSVQRFG
eukprot:TRINITY_DN51264_c0_g1_i1.p1 TRINITY_DN51264_c0_g1~~TRINITY_DN51264_c0_g1_i1.p1  ORF type:complete len:604 (-),score=159.70 TRINITY_DN51264_c0_g1_i1:31-1842(-)